MSPKKKLLIVFIVEIALYVLAALAIRSEQLHLCGMYSRCSNVLFDQVGMPLRYFLLVIIPFTVFLFLLPDAIIRYWVKNFTIVLIVTTGIILIPTHCGFMCILDQADSAHLIAILFVAVSVFAIIVHSIQHWIDLKKQMKIPS